MKYIVSFLLLGLLAAPAMAQRPHRGDHKKPDQRVEKHVGEKDCQKKCAALEKQVQALRKRLAEVMKEKGVKSDRRGRGVRGSRGDRRGDIRGHRRGSRGDSGRGRWTPKKEKVTPKKPHGYKQLDQEGMKRLLELRKKWATRSAGR